MSKAISSRHIRHDWKTFVEWEQNSVRTLCEVTSRHGLTGIPGITEQPRMVDNKWGWCMRCVKRAVHQYDEAYPQVKGSRMASLYSDMLSEIQDQFGLNRVREAARDLELRKRYARQSQVTVI